jgi:hypothetical protein
VGQQLVDVGFELLRKVLQLRAQPRLQALGRPDQLFTKGRQRGTASLTALHQRGREELRPLLDQIPRVPIGHLGLFGRARDFPGRPHVVQEIQHHLHGFGIAVLRETPDRFDCDADQLLPRIPAIGPI